VPVLAAALRTLLADRALATELGAQGRAKVHNRLTWDHVTAAFADLYAEVAGTRRDERRVVGTPTAGNLVLPRMTGGDRGTEVPGSLGSGS
jgi:hypothetical protein